MNYHSLNEELKREENKLRNLKWLVRAYEKLTWKEEGTLLDEIDAKKDYVKFFRWQMGLGDRSKESKLPIYTLTTTKLPFTKLKLSYPKGLSNEEVYLCNQILFEIVENDKRISRGEEEHRITTAKLIKRLCIVDEKIGKFGLIEPEQVRDAVVDLCMTCIIEIDSSTSTKFDDDTPLLLDRYDVWEAESLYNLFNKGIIGLPY